MANTVVALFSDADEALKTLDELRAAGFGDEDIGLMANAEACSVRESDARGGHRAKVGRGVVAGAAIGGAGLAALAIPGIGPVLALGPLAAGLLGAGVGSVAGGILAELRNLGVPEEDAGCLCEAIRRGGTVVTVNAASDEAAERASEILGSHRLIDLDDCRTTWTESGWHGFDPNAEHIPASPAVGAPKGLPFDPDSMTHRARRERRDRRSVRSYVRVR